MPPAVGLFDGPANKKPKMTEDDLIPEAEWMAKVRKGKKEGERERK